MARSVTVVVRTAGERTAEACAGLRFLIAMIVLGVLFANITFYTWSRRLLFMLLAVAIPIVANGFRALMIVLIAYWSDHTIAVGVDHIVFGWVFLTFVTVLILATGMAMLSKLGKEHFFLWAWGINGSFSVVGAVLVPILGVVFGLSTGLLVAAACYAACLPAFYALLAPKPDGAAAASRPAFQAGGD